MQKDLVVLMNWYIFFSYFIPLHLVELIGASLALIHIFNS